MSEEIESSRPIPDLDTRYHEGLNVQDSSRSWPRKLSPNIKGNYSIREEVDQDEPKIRS